MNSWIWLLTLSVFVCVDAVDFMQADSDFGELFLIQNQTGDGEWSVLYIEKGIYFRRESSQSICVDNNGYYGQCLQSIEFLPRTLSIRQLSQANFPDGVFQSWFFKRLRTLRMSEVGLAEFHRTGLIGTDALNNLDLSQNAITKMPSKAFSNAWNLTKIDLSYNEIKSMASDVFKIENDQNSTKIQALMHLEVILLNNNALTFINAEWFSNLVELSTLALNDNLFIEFNACSAFSTNNALRTLQLQNNEFSVLKTNELADGQCLDQLNSFDISNNLKNDGSQTIRINAKTINISYTNSRECFIPSHAAILRASRNRIESIVVDELPNTSLLELYLSYNKINSTDSLIDLEHLQIIDLSYNELTEVNGKVFQRMLNLKTLNIAHNKFTTIDLAFLKFTEKLTDLDISNNLLSGSFKLHVKAVALSVLNISNNNYTSVQHNLRTQTPNLTSIDMNGNHYDCEDLASIILFLNLDHITPVVRSDGDFGNTNNVRGIQCYKSEEEMIVADPRNISKNYETTKEQLTKTIDDKFVKLETKLIDLFNNVSTSNVTDNAI